MTIVSRRALIEGKPDKRLLSVQTKWIQGYTGCLSSEPGKKLILERWEDIIIETCIHMREHHYNPRNQKMNDGYTEKNLILTCHDHILYM